MAEKKEILDLRMETRREADKTKREISEKVEKIRSKGFKPEDLKNLGYLSKADKLALNEQSVIIHEKDEEISYDGNNGSGPFNRNSSKKHGNETPDEIRNAEANFTN